MNAEQERFKLIQSLSAMVDMTYDTISALNTQMKAAKEKGDTEGIAFIKGGLEKAIERARREEVELDSVSSRIVQVVPATGWRAVFEEGGWEWGETIAVFALVEKLNANGGLEYSVKPMSFSSNSPYAFVVGDEANFLRVERVDEESGWQKLRRAKKK